MEGEVVAIAQFNFRHEAETAVEYLRDAEINSVLSADDAGGAGVGFSQYEPVRVVVLQTDVDRAREVLEAAGVLSTESEGEGL